MEKPLYFTSFFIILLACCVGKLVYGTSSEELDEVSFCQTRVVTNLEIIYGAFGVPIDKRYNETKSKDYLTSAPGCPKSIDGFPWVWYKMDEETRCFLAGHAGPCKFGEKLLIDKSDPNFGICACQCMVDNKSGKLTLPSGSERFVVCENNRTEAGWNGQFFDTYVNECYKRFDEGPCDSGEVLVEWSGTKVKCLKVCDTRDSNWKMLEKQRKCTSAQSWPTPLRPKDHIAEHSKECEKWDKVYSKKLRKCVDQVDEDKDDNDCELVPTPSPKQHYCPFGKRYSNRLGKCIRTFTTPKPADKGKTGTKEVKIIIRKK